MCGEEKDLVLFFSAKGRADKKAGLCKICYSELKRIYDQTPKGRYVMYKKGAKCRGYTFTLTMDEFMSFWNRDCFYCGDKINGIGLDRIDNSVGYELFNLVSCCKTCNLMKRISSSEEFINQCKKIAKFNK